MLGTRVVRKGFQSLLLAAAFGALAAGSASAAWYAAPWGSGSACKAYNPCTLAKAQAKVRAANDAMSGDLVVRLLGGTYRLGQTWNLTEADSGTNGHDVVYEAAPGASPTLSGGKAIPRLRWKLIDPANRIWRAKVGDLELRQLYVDGVRARRAAAVPAIDGTVTRTETGLHTTGTGPQSWASPTDVELVWRSDEAGAFNWVEPRCRVTGVSGDANGTDIAVAQPCFERMIGIYSSDTPGGGLELGAPTWAENDVTFLQDDTRPGRWALDRDPNGNTIYYRARKGQNPRHENVVAASVETLVKVQGTGAPARNIVLRGITFAESTWYGPERPEGFPNIFANGYGVTPDAIFDIHGEAFPPGAVDLSNTEEIRIQDSRFERIGSIGVRMGDNATRNEVTGSTFRDLSAGAILLGRLGPDLNGQADDNVIANNVIDGVGVEYASSPGIFTSYARGTLISHNYVANTGFTGIGTRGSWDGEGSTERNRVVGNFVEEVLRRSEDGGGIYGVYIQGTSYENGLFVEDNVVRNGRDDILHFGLYTDIGSDYTTVRNNVSYGFLLPGGGCADPYVAHVQSTGNYLDGPTLFFCGGPADEDVLIDNEFINPGDPEGSCAAIPACAAIVAQAGLEPGHAGLRSTVLSFDDHPIYEDAPGPDFPVTGVHGGVDFGTGLWVTSYDRPGYALTTPARFAGGGTERTLRLAPGLKLRSLRLEGTGSYSIGDGTTTLSGTLNGAGNPKRVSTSALAAGAALTLTLSAGEQTLVDDLVVVG